MFERTKLALEITQKVSKLLRKAFRERNFSIERKADNSLVTETDRQAEKFLVDQVRKQFSDDGIVAEEGSHHQSQSGYSWYIDPIDGSRNFALGVPLYAVSIGITKNNEPFAGIVAIPELEEFYVAERGFRGAFLNNTPILVSEINEISKANIVIASSQLSAISRGPQEFKFRNFLKHIAAVRMFGSVVVGISYVASGRLDGAVVFLQHPWDITAGMVLVQEAGGKVTDLYGNPASLNSSDLVFSNGKIHNELLSLINPNHNQ